MLIDANCWDLCLGQVLKLVENWTEWHGFPGQGIVKASANLSTQDALESNC